MLSEITFPSLFAPIGVQKSRVLHTVWVTADICFWLKQSCANNYRNDAPLNFSLTKSLQSCVPSVCLGSILIPNKGATQIHPETQRRSAAAQGSCGILVLTFHFYVLLCAEGKYARDGGYQVVCLEHALTDEQHMHLKRIGRKMPLLT